MSMSGEILLEEFGPDVVSEITTATRSASYRIGDPRIPSGVLKERGVPNRLPGNHMHCSSWLALGTALVTAQRLAAVRQTAVSESKLTWHENRYQDATKIQLVYGKT